MNSFICAIGTATPPHKIAQMQTADFMATALQMNAEETRKLKALYRVTGIAQRYTVLPDYATTNGEFTFFPNTPDLEPFPTVKQRMGIYQHEALPLSVAAIEDCFTTLEEFDRSSITHLITVSCTGMYAPGLDIDLIQALDLPTTTQRTQINFMGCYAAFNALKVADAFCQANTQARVLVVCTELCTIHFQKYRENDHLVSNAIFGDGSAAVLVQAKPMANQINVALAAFHCELIPAGKKEMAWHIANHGFEMTLSSYVPDLIQKGIKNLTQKLLQHLGIDLTTINLYAIHPGGRKILESIEKALDLQPEHNCFAYEILRDYGNMSSATVLFVLKSLLSTLTPAHHNQPVLSFAFGPGLTLESMLLKVHYV
ncbi:type III polyketide synthase [Adhaeribacter pallidiroseus]|uniref:Acridone synthase n=1 Tax=Adhaeribacter pallidiroseus TaxID=2072847 RepID=A0A369QFQ4_9BACT|nr:type III polyketide synthase [Adhaeribacter pallidiroseus]RDC61729.1 Acridone synthase [Adhaeribacter pallidiroseus]